MIIINFEIRGTTRPWESYASVAMGLLAQFDTTASKNWHEAALALCYAQWMSVSEDHFE